MPYIDVRIKWERGSDPLPGLNPRDPDNIAYMLNETYSANYSEAYKNFKVYPIKTAIIIDEEKNESKS